MRQSEHGESGSALQPAEFDLWFSLQGNHGEGGSAMQSAELDFWQSMKKVALPCVHT